MIRNWTLAAFAAAALTVAPATADDKSAGKMGVSDSLFAAVAADGGMAEMQMAEMGVKKAHNPELKKFSEHMLESHRTVSSQLKEMAAKKGITLPATVSVGHQFCAQSLATLSGEEFDHAYTQAQYIAHMSAISAFKAEADRGQDADVKAWAAKTLPSLEEHLRELRPMAMHHESHHEKEHSAKTSK